jgi:mevalonate kinase
MIKEFYSNGKLLLTGEYAVLDGAAALSIPTRYGQSVEKAEDSFIRWKSFDVNNTLWFETNLLLKNNEIVPLEDQEHPIREKLIEILQSAKNLNPNFLTDSKGYIVTTKLDFPRDWGLGTSSTLLNNIANWANVDAYQLLQNSFGGSGYDIASARNNTPILYQLKDGHPIVDAVNLNWNFKDQLFFVYLNKKQNSHHAIKSYQSKGKPSQESIQKISSMSLEVIDCKSLNEFELLMDTHEKCISELIQQKTIKELLFKDYKGAIKSLGAWGGDFILATGNEIQMDYFRKKGYATSIPFDEMILK